MKARKLPSGNYNVQYYYTDIEGNKKRGSITRPTKAEAEYEGNRIKMENSNVLGGDVKLMVNKAIKDKAAVLSPSTLRGYKKVLKNAIEGSPFGKVSLSTINTVQVQAWITWMIGMGYSPKSVKNAYGVFLSPHLHLKNGSVEPFFYVSVHYAFTMSRKYVRDFQKTPHQAVGGMP